MKKLFLVPVIALILASGIVSAGCSNFYGGCSQTNPSASFSNHCEGTDAKNYICLIGVCGDVITHCGSEGCQMSNGNAGCVPEFTSLGMGIALIGAGTGYALIRRKLKK